MPQTIAGQQTTAMPTPDMGAFQTGLLPDEPTMTEYKTAIATYVEGQPGNPGTQDFIGMFCDFTSFSTVEMSERSMEFTLAGIDGGRPDAQHVKTVKTPIAEAKKYWLASAINQDAWLNGMTAERLREHTISPLQADRRLCNRLILGVALTPGGWYNADLTPPPYLMNTFDSSHDHYISYDQDGVVTPENHSYAKWHIGHHGVPDQVVCLTNSATRCAVEQEYGGFQGADGAYESLPFIHDLNRFGFRLGAVMSGVPTVFNDAIPTGYALYIALGALGKPMMWRHWLAAETRSLMRYQNSDIPNVEFKWWGDFVRVGYPTIYRPEMGLAMKLNATGDVAYAAPTGILAIAA